MVLFDSHLLPHEVLLFSEDPDDPGSYRVIVAQRNGEFDLLKILQSRNDPGTLVTVEDGATVELER